jgi:hypothetical protein
VATTTELTLPAATIKEGDTLTAAVHAADGYEVGGQVRFSAPGWSQTVWADHGVATVTLPGTLRGGEQAITAEYLGHEYLTASQDSEPVTVLATRVSAEAPVGGVVAPTLSLTLGAPVAFGAFTPGIAKDYTASTTATVTSTAGDATLSASAVTLANGAFRLARPVAIAPARTTWTGPVSNDVVPIAFTQSIGASEPLRTGAYTGTVTMTLATTSP